MSNIAKQRIFIVDDQANAYETIRETLEQLGAKATCFVSAVECLEQLSSQACDLLITDLKMPEMDGIELVTKVKRQKPWMPIVIVTGYGDIPTAVKAIKAGAADFFEKPLDKKDFIQKIRSLLLKNGNRKQLGEPLTWTEEVVVKLILDGKSNKQIANLLSRSQRTIEMHRSRIMRKLGADSLVDLVKRALMIGLVDCH
ncbi:MAG: response regulator [Planctomycetota bacterium]|nr:response regulator [Planctomycetota bacterium]